MYKMNTFRSVSSDAATTVDQEQSACGQQREARGFGSVADDLELIQTRAGRVSPGDRRGNRRLDLDVAVDAEAGAAGVKNRERDVRPIAWEPGKG